MKAVPYNKAEATKTTAENNKHTEDKEMSENMKLNDEAMAQASGGKLEPGQEGATITGIVMVDPYPDNPAYSGIYRECESNGYQVYEITGGRIAVADRHIPNLNPGDEVIVNHIRGYYGWEIIKV